MYIFACKTPSKHRPFIKTKEVSKTVENTNSN